MVKPVCVVSFLASPLRKASFLLLKAPLSHLSVCLPAVLLEEELRKEGGGRGRGGHGTYFGQGALAHGLIRFGYRTVRTGANPALRKHAFGRRNSVLSRPACPSGKTPLLLRATKCTPAVKVSDDL